MKFTITTADGVTLNGDTDAGQEFKIADNGILTFLDAPEEELPSAVAYSPSAWVRVSHTVKARKGGGAAFVG